MTTQSITDDFDHENLFLTHRLNDGERDWRDIPNMAPDSLSFGDACLVPRSFGVPGRC